MKKLFILLFIGFLYQNSFSQSKPPNLSDFEKRCDKNLSSQEYAWCLKNAQEDWYEANRAYNEQKRKQREVANKSKNNGNKGSVKPQ